MNPRFSFSTAFLVLAFLLVPIGQGPASTSETNATLEIDLDGRDLTFHLTGDSNEANWVLQHSPDGLQWEDLLVLEPGGNGNGPNVSLTLDAVPGNGVGLNLFRARESEEADPAQRDWLEARMRWRCAGLENYRYEVRWNWSFFTWHGTITVTDGEVTGTETIMAFPEDIEVLDRLTIDGWFDKVATARAQGAEIVDVTWNAELGHPEKGFIDVSTLIADEEQSWEILSLTPTD